MFQELKPLVRIGKNGTTESIIKEIKTQLKKNIQIKIKVLRSAMDQTDVVAISKEISKKTNSEVLQIIGLNIVIKSKHIKNKKN